MSWALNIPKIGNKRSLTNKMDTLSFGLVFECLKRKYIIFSKLVQKKFSSDVLEP